jgi:hypothetical protein
MTDLSISTWRVLWQQYIDNEIKFRQAYPPKTITETVWLFKVATASADTVDRGVHMNVDWRL